MKAGFRIWKVGLLKYHRIKWKYDGDIPVTEDDLGQNRGMKPALHTLIFTTFFLGNTRNYANGIK